MPPRIILDDRFLSEDDVNLNNYNGWSARDADWDVDDGFIYDSGLFRTDTIGAYSWINTAPREFYPDNGYGIAYGWTFYNTSGTDYDQAVVFGASDNTSKNDWWQSGVRIRILKYYNTTDNARIRIYNGNVVVYDELINFVTDTTQAYTFTRFEPDGTGSIVFTQEGKAFIDNFSVDVPWHFPGRFYGSITNRNGQQQINNRCYSSCDRIQFSEYQYGDYVITGHVYRHNLLLPGARVTCVSRTDDSFLGRAVTDSEGTYRFSDLNPHLEYDIMASYASGGAAYTDLARSRVVPRFIPNSNT